MENNISANISNVSTIPNQPAKISFSLWSATKIILILMIIAIVFGNGLVLVTTWLDKRLHQPSKYFVACLAVADLFVGIFSVPIRLYLHLNPTILASIHICRFWIWTDICCEVASIVTLMVISIDRYYKISHPFRYRSQMLTSKCVFIISNIWLISALHATLGMFSYDDSVGLISLPGKGCINDNKVYITVTAVLFFIFPLLIIVFMYTLVFYVAHSQQKRNRKGKLGRTLSSRSKKPNKEFYQELKTVRMLVLVVGAFVVCWAPFFILFLIGTYKPEYLPKNVHTNQILATTFSVILPSFNSLCNPIIYACFDRGYNNAFKQLLKRVLSCEFTSKKNTKLNRSLSNTQSSNFITRTTTESPMNNIVLEERLIDT